MTPTRIFDIFKELFPEKAKEITSFKRHDENSIEMTKTASNSSRKTKYIFSIPKSGWELKEVKNRKGENK